MNTGSLVYSSLNHSAIPHTNHYNSVNNMSLQMNLVAAATTVGVFLLCWSPWFGAECSVKTFRLSESGGSVMCAMSEANQTTSVSDLPDDGTPLEVRCARQCTYDAPCHSFNYRSDHHVCQFYHYQPNDCQPDSNCKYFQVKDFSQGRLHCIPPWLT